MRIVRLFRHALLLTFLLPLVAACSHRQPVRHLVSDVCLVVPGQTTKQEVLSYLGVPAEKQEMPDGSEVWTYSEVHKSFLRKTPYVGDRLGDQVVERAIVTFDGDLVRTCVYREPTLIPKPEAGDAE